MLLQAVKDGDLNKVKTILWSPNCTENELMAVDSMGDTALSLATRLGHIDIMVAIVISPQCTEKVFLK